MCSPTAGQSGSLWAGNWMGCSPIRVARASAKEQFRAGIGRSKAPAPAIPGRRSKKRAPLIEGTDPGRTHQARSRRSWQYPRRREMGSRGWLQRTWSSCRVHRRVPGFPCRLFGEGEVGAWAGVRGCFPFPISLYLPRGAFGRKQLEVCTGHVSLRGLHGPSGAVELMQEIADGIGRAFMRRYGSEAHRAPRTLASWGCRVGARAHGGHTNTLRCDSVKLNCET